MEHRLIRVAINAELFRRDVNLRKLGPSQSGAIALNRGHIVLTKSS
jgi:hypothetical protein